MADFEWSDEHMQQHIQITASITALLSSAASGRKRQVLPPLDKFDGKNIESWLLSARAKLRVDGEAIEILSYATAAENKKSWNPDDLLARLDAYREPNAARRAGQELHALKQQPAEAITAFIPRFEEVLFRASADAWPDAAKINCLVSCLNAEWQQRLNERTELAEAYEKFVSDLRAMAGQFTRYSVISRPSTSHRPQTSGGDPMDVSIGTASTVPANQRAAWKKAGRCTGCGSKRHWSNACPKAAPKPAETGLRVTFATPAQHSSQDSELDSS
ncbi:hypothetical protein F5X96DRAFT_377257 [Biscogniauxia mediterranea]|nr:hypothetical protein F5X96DRAFT_377257 [Biscogniauxia mediterranea]